MNVWKKMKACACSLDWWRAVLSYLIAIASLAGFLLVLLNPSCWFSPGGQCSGFDIYNAWEPYPGKADGLQFFTTGLLAAAALFSWPALREQIVRGNKGKCVAALLKFCFLIGHPGLLLGICIDINEESEAIFDNLISEPAGWIIIGLAIIMAPLGWIFIFLAGLNTRGHTCSKLKKLFSLLRRALMPLAHFVRRSVR